jgi:hypothetical protein
MSRFVRGDRLIVAMYARGSKTYQGALRLAYVVGVYPAELVAPRPSCVLFGFALLFGRCLQLDPVPPQEVDERQ